MKAYSICKLASALVFFTAGCDNNNVKVYHLEAGDSATPAPVPVASAGMPVSMPAALPVPDNSSQPPLKYTLPAGWNEKALTQMRVASFDVTENGQKAEVSVIPLGGMAGGDLANVNRWRGQVGELPLADDELQKLAEKVEVAGQPADLFDVSGTSPGSGDPERIVGVIFHRDDTAWFFKVTGDPDLVEKQKTAFVSFLKSLEFGGLAAPSTMDISQLPPSHPSIAGMSPAAPAAPVAPADDKPIWTVPADWREGPLAQFLVAKYVIAGAGDVKAEVNVSSLAGDGGGLASNVNRWRGQLGLARATDNDLAKLATIDANGAKATIMDFAGTNPRTGKPAELVGVVLPLAGQTWFYKLMGDAELVAQQKDALIKFVQSAQYPDAHQ